MNFTKKRIMYTVIVSFIVVFSTTFAILMTLERMDYRNYLQGEYSKNMYELITSVDNIRSNLTKSAVVGSREQSITVFDEIFRFSAMANDKLNSLPISQETTANTSKFLSQVGDFSAVLVKNISEGKELTKEDYENIEKLKLQSIDLQKQLDEVSNEINQGKVNWGEIRKKASGVFAKSKDVTVSQKFKDIQKQVAQYPALIYDGPFSDNNIDIKPKINGMKKVSQAEAEDTARKAAGGNKVEDIQLDKNKSDTIIPTYRFNIKMKDRESKENIICEVSQNGGKIVYLLDSLAPAKSNIDISKATDIGSKYLNNFGYKNMVPIYKIKYGNTAVITYVYQQNNYIIYPDQIKLKISLDNGSITGVESQKYLVSHVENRKIPSPKISQEEGRKKVGKNLQIYSVRLALVPTISNNEALCYEYTGTYKGDTFIVYINSQNGYEQRILQIINTPNGQLTM